jgi:hypothetical protein
MPFCGCLLLLRVLFCGLALSSRNLCFYAEAGGMRMYYGIIYKRVTKIRRMNTFFVFEVILSIAHGAD